MQPYRLATRLHPGRLESLMPTHTAIIRVINCAPLAYPSPCMPSLAFLHAASPPATTAPAPRLQRPPTGPRFARAFSYPCEYLWPKQRTRGASLLPLSNLSDPIHNQRKCPALFGAPGIIGKASIYRSTHHSFRVRLQPLLRLMQCSHCIFDTFPRCSPR